MATVEPKKASLRLRFWVTLMMQAIVILAIPAQAIYTQTTGKSIVLQTALVDPYNPLQGYHVTLSYAIANAATLKTLPGWETVERQIQQHETKADRGFLSQESTEFYVILQAPSDAAESPQPWQPIAVSAQLPDRLKSNEVALRGIYRQGDIRYGLETYYIPEDQQTQLSQQIQALQERSRQAAVLVEVKVGTAGQAVPIGFWLGGQRYQF